MPSNVAFVALVSAILGYASLQSGVNAVVNGPWLDFLQRTLSRSEPQSPVVLVESRTPTESPQLIAGTRALLAAGAEQVGVMADPAQAHQLQDVFADSDKTVKVAWPVRPGGDVPAGWALPPNTEPGAPVYALPAGSGPPYRSQPLLIPTQEGPKPTIEASLANATAGETGRFAIDYRGGLAHLPRVSLASAATGNFLASVVRGRTALIAATERWSSPILATPVAGPGLTAAQVHAFALRTLLEGRPLWTLPSWLAALGLLAASSIAGWIAVFLGARTRALYIMGLFLVAAVASVGLFAGFGLIFPGAELVLALVTPAVVVFVRREHEEDKLLARLVGRARVRARERDRSVQEEEDAWQLVARLVAENLNLSRTVFLELLPNGTHLSSVAGVNADGSAIQERRRDIRRAPYTRATTPNTPVEVDRTYLVPEHDQERQFLVPLAFAGRTLGFWAFTTPKGTEPEEEGTLATVPVFAERAAELLYLGRSPAQERRGWRRLFGGSGSKQLSAELAQSLRVTERQTTLLEGVLAELSTAVAVFDTYGRPMHVNRAMAELGQENGLAPYRSTATDLLVELAGFSREQARAYHRQAVLGAEKVHEPLEEPIAGKRYMLLVTGLKLDSVGGEGASGADAEGNLGTGGVLIAFSDYTSAANLFQLTEALGRFVNTRLRNDLEAIQMASELLTNPQLPPERLTKAANLLQQAVQRADDELEMLDQQFLRASADEQASAHPLDPVLVLNRALGGVQSLAAEAGVSVRFDPPALSAPVWALSEALYAVLRAAAALVIDAARPGEAMAVTYAEDTSTARIRLQASGFGMPDERLQGMLTQAERDEPEVARILRAGQRQLQDWGGDLSGQAAVGEGVAITIVLRRALRASETTEAD